MGSPVRFSGQHLELSEISQHYRDLEASLRIYFSPASPDYPNRFAGYLETEIRDEMELRLAEHSRTTALSVLSALEAVLRIDYLQRCYKKKKDQLSRAFRTLHQRKGSRASLENEILTEWKNHSTVPEQLIGNLKGAFKYRHWLAHGRYWLPRLGQKYDYESVYLLAEAVLTVFPLEGVTDG